MPLSRAQAGYLYNHPDAEVVLGFIRDNPGCTTLDMRDCGINPPRGMVAKLHSLGLIIYSGSSNPVGYRRWVANDKTQ